MGLLLRLCGLLRGRSGKAIAAALTWCAAGSSAAACFEYRLPPSSWRSTAQAACNDAGGGAEVVARNVLGNAPNFSCSVDVKRDDGAGVNVGHRVFAIESREVPECADQCKDLSGKETTINWTIGYTRTPNISTDSDWKLIGPANKVPSDGLMCDPTTKCTMAATYAGATPWQSLSPTAQGTYRLSLDFSAQHLGQSCTPSDKETAAASPKAPIPPCPGAVGEVNGVAGCYGTATNPTAADVPEPKPAPAQPGNPAAGEKPSTGPGSGTGGAGRTPTTGNGGPAGGPIGAAGTGKAPDGTTPKPEEGKEQAACGAPGQAKCAIDETGTPDGKAAFDKGNKALDEVDAKRKEMLDGLKSTADKDTSWGVVPSWMAHGGCTAWNLGTLPLGVGITLEIDVCRVMPYVEAVMSFLWAAFTFFATIAMVFRVTTASKD